jgi:hypothetical protein
MGRVVGYGVSQVPTNGMLGGMAYQDPINVTVNNISVGSGTLTGTASQPLQVTGGAYVSGNIGIGLTNPAEKLQVQGRVVGTSGLRAGTTAAIASSGEALSVLGQATIRLDSPTSAATYLINADTTVSTIQPFLLCNDTGGNRSGIGIEYSTTITSFYGQGGISLQTGTSGFGYANERLRISSGGQVTITGANATTATTLSLYNGTSGGDNQVLVRALANGGGDAFIKFDCGGNDMVVGNLYAGTTNNQLVLGAGTSAANTVGIKIDGNGQLDTFAMRSGAGIDFSANANAAGMTSELLDDYEEGTWTPTFGRSATDPTVSYAAGAAGRIGTYTKIGNMVYAFWDMTSTAYSGGSGDAWLKGLPFNVSSTQAGYSVAQWRDSGSVPAGAAGTILRGYAQQSNAYIALQYDRSGANGFGYNSTVNNWQTGRTTGYVIYQTNS